MLQTFFSRLRDELQEVVPRYTGATAHAINLLYRDCDKRAYGDGDRKVLRERALEAFCEFHSSGCQVDTTNLSLVRAYLHRWLDEVTRCPLEVDLKFDSVERELARNLSCGPGSSQGRHGDTTSSYHKLTGRAAVSSVVALREYLALERFRPDLRLARGAEGFGISLGCNLTTVPKDARMDRVIAIEPDVNVRLQGAMGAVLEKRLSRMGIHLDTQQSFNRLLARQGSIDGSLATIDLRRASDSLSDVLLRHILPSWVYELIKAYSSPIVKDGAVLSGRVVLTMGNGITFPLQTLIFAAAAFTACRLVGVIPRINENVAVFGDDIIVPTEAYDAAVELLTQMGCTVNDSKSFADGPFRESCGADWYEGYLVRPFMPRGDLFNDAQTLCSAFNQANAWVSRTGIELRCLDDLIAYAASQGWELPVIPMHAPIDGGIRAIRPGLTSRYVRSVF